MSHSAEGEQHGGGVLGRARRWLGQPAVVEMIVGRERCAATLARPYVDVGITLIGFAAPVTAHRVVP